eukprot:TRINITY_DN73801_c0_g1_i1.p1 TRINITY_DN73801_c0_g1~~TRINITY_DN73801_c0_g1_i1.p1  ORF type:complete len:1551 (+),score=187.84 TRINITY_DN73801_c0_g1_i1:478-4653(+)
MPSAGGASCHGPLTSTQPCGARVQIDCVFGSWGTWTSCSKSCDGGFATRVRRVRDEAHHDGAPCLGDIEESKFCGEHDCAYHNATVSEWTEWSNCSSAGAALQRFRERHVVQSANGSGTRFTGSLKETNACPMNKTDCAASSWSDWSACSTTCGTGQITRTRSVTPAKNGGTCSLTNFLLKTTDSCQNPTCDPPRTDCVLALWSEWSACDVSCGKGSNRRTRSVNTSAVSGGKACIGILEEVRKCIGVNGTLCPDDSKWQDWGAWTECSVTCGGGDRSRHRKLIVGEKMTALQNYTSAEVIPCNTQRCSDCTDGVYSAWSNWSACSSSCSGYMQRNRVGTPPNSCGKPLEGLSQEFSKCNDDVPCSKDVDCKISEWSDWSNCSASCSGTKLRKRSLLSDAVGHGARCGDAALSQVLSCNPSPGEDVAKECYLNANCTWGEWSSWGNCSKDCGGGETTRARAVLVPSKGHGIPCVGDFSEIAACNTQRCVPSDVCIDCKWGNWGQWSECTHCGGQRTRSRDLEEIPTPCGKQCDSKAAAEISNCTSICTMQFPCGWSDWSDVMTCSESGCSSADSLRTRSLRLLDLNDSSPMVLFKGPQDVFCSGTMISHSSCPVPPSCKAQCEPQNCTFSAWSDWSGAEKGGVCQRQRTIERANNECGLPCNAQLVTTKNCAVIDIPTDCTWSDWEAWSVCEQLAGEQTKRQRHVVATASAGGAACEGSASETLPCFEAVPAQSCLLSNWTMWSSCSSSCGSGTRERSRSIEREADAGGSPCVGSLKELGPCVEAACNITVVNCVLSDWTPFTQCDVQRLRIKTRSVLVNATNGGDSCSGDLIVAETCPEEKVDCIVSDWTEWDLCTATCDGGKRNRLRQINTLARGGGRQCPSSLIETGSCNTQDCVVTNCKMADWSDWSVCSAKCGNGQQTRGRVVQNYASLGGIGCTGNLDEMRSCVDNCTKVDCLLTDWSDWSACTCSCAGGQHERTRSVAVRPQNGGLACEEGAFEQVEPCNTQTCSTETCIDGEWDSWSEWSVCSSSCLGGTSFRSRKASRMANACGKATSGDSLQTRFCNVGKLCEPDVDCAFRQWSAWSTCSDICDGTQDRRREVNQSGRGNGAFCQGALKEISWCNRVVNGTGPAACLPEVAQDCILGEWSIWSNCSLACGRGERSRSRAIVQLPKRGGKACNAALDMVEECNSNPCGKVEKPIDCKFGDWGDWSACSKCGGEKRRLRHIISFPASGGAPCDYDAIEEVTSCSISCEPTVCSWSDWAAWGDCRSACGRGHRSRVRVLGVASSSSSSSSVALPDVDAVLGAYTELQAQTQSLEHNRFSELIASFSCGLVSIIAVLGAWRLFGRFAGRSTVHRTSGESRDHASRDGLISEQGPLLGSGDSSNFA